MVASTVQRKGCALPILVAVSWGELLDKHTILELKSERIADPAKLAHVRLEAEALRPSLEQALGGHSGLAALLADLKAVNGVLWEVEDEIRDCERRQAFGPRFIELARAVYHENDRRSLLKRRINELMGSELMEEKSYQAY